jgi:hypothetical protein
MSYYSTDETAGHYASAMVSDNYAIRLNKYVAIYGGRFWCDSVEAGVFPLFLAKPTGEEVFCFVNHHSKEPTKVLSARDSCPVPLPPIAI